MNKAVITTGGKQYVVQEGDTLAVELLSESNKTVDFEPLLTVIDGKVSVGTPIVKGAKVTADINEADVKAEKVTAIRYKSKKRVRKVRGHRQRHAHITIKKIA